MGEDKNSDDKVVRDRKLAVKNKLLAIKLYDKEFRDWGEESKKLTKRYRAEVPTLDTYAVDAAATFNLYWANIQTYAPSLYSRTPISEVSGRNKDDKQSLTKIGAEILERALRFQTQNYDFDAAVFNPVMDLLLPGRGISRIYYEPEFALDPATGEKRVTKEKVTARYVHWKDFQHNSARTWDEVTEVRFRSYMDSADVERRFGPEIAKKLKYTYLPTLCEDEKVVSSEEQEQFKKAEIWECWNKPSRKVCWVSNDYKDDYLDEVEDPLGLQDFYPCPKPLYGTLTTDSLVPVPDARQVKHLYDSLDTCQSKIDAFTKDLHISGIYDGQYEEIEKLLNSGNKLIPIKNFAAIQKDGGLKGVVEFWPLDQVVAALDILYRQKSELKSDIYEITGFSDTMRGVSDPRETATAQQIKGQFALTRLTNRQRDVQRFARDLLALKGEVIAEHFSPENLMAMTGMEFIPEPPQPQAPPPMPGQPPMPPPPPLTPEMIQQQKQQIYLKACELLRSDSMRRFKIDIETDSTINQDEAANQQARADYLQSVSGFMQAMLPIVKEAPEIAPAFGEMLMFVSNTYKAGRGVTTTLENMVDSMKEAAEAAKNAPPKPDPKEVEVQGKMKLAEMEANNAMTLSREKAAQDSQLVMEKSALQQEKAQLDAERKQIESQSKMEIERIQAAADIEVQREKARSDIQIKTLQAQLDLIKHQRETEKEVIQSQGSGGGSSRGSTDVKIRMKSPGARNVRIKGADGKEKVYRVEDEPDEEAVN